MVLVWILVADPIIRPVLLVSTLTACVHVGRLSLLETKAVCENAAIFGGDVHLYLPIKCKAWECLIAKVNFMFRNSPAHHCLSQHAGEIVLPNEELAPSAV